MLENDLVLGTFAEKNLSTMKDPLLEQYERLLNAPDMEIFKWLTDKTPVPKEFENEVYFMIKEHANSGQFNKYQFEDEEDK